MVSPALANMLAARRPLFNKRVAEARHRLPALDTAVFGAFVSESLDAVCVAVERIDPLATLAAVDCAFDLGLDLVGQRLAGPAARLPWVDRAWQRLATPMAHLLARSPLDALGAITNAVIRLGDVPGVRVESWIDEMASLAGRCADIPQLRAVGALCAWRAGMAHLRSAALGQAGLLDPALASAALGAPAMEWNVLQERLLADRWWHPGKGVTHVDGQTVGGFSGFGGPFAAPPSAKPSADGFVVQSGERYFLVMADAFGAVVLPATADEFARATQATEQDAAITPGGVRVQGRDVVFAVPGAPVKAVAGKDSVALFSPWTHWLRIVPVAA